VFLSFLKLEFNFLRSAFSFKADTQFLTHDLNNFHHLAALFLLKFKKKASWAAFIERVKA